MTTKSTIKCRGCGEAHLTVKCPLRSPDQRPRSWKQQNEAFDKNNQAKAFQCVIPIQSGKNAHVYADTVQEFWRDIQVAADHAIHRDFVGIRSVEETMALIPCHDKKVQPGKYRLVSRTHAFSDKDLEDAIAQAVRVLKEQRPLHWNAAKQVQSELLLQYNHFSLSHEGNSMALDETRLVFELIIGNDWKHPVEDNTLCDELKGIKASENDIVEARNHIFVSEQLQDLAKLDISETLVLQLHSWVMSGLLVKEDEGLAGEYRKCPIFVSGSDMARPSSADVPPLMKRFFEYTMVHKDDEGLFDYLSRIHSEFQHIHPFRDGNGRIGRILINLILMKHGYPVLVLPSTLSGMFNHAVHLGTHKKLRLFTRLLEEAIFKSLQIYEDALPGVSLLPTVENVFGLKVGDASVPVVVSP